MGATGKTKRVGHQGHHILAFPGKILTLILNVGDHHSNTATHVYRQMIHFSNNFVAVPQPITPACSQNICCAPTAQQITINCFSQAALPGRSDFKGHSGGSGCAGSAYFVTPPTECPVRGHTYREWGSSFIRSSSFYAWDKAIHVPQMTEYSLIPWPNATSAVSLFGSASALGDSNTLISVVWLEPSQNTVAYLCFTHTVY